MCFRDDWYLIPEQTKAYSDINDLLEGIQVAILYYNDHIVEVLAVKLPSGSIYLHLLKSSMKTLKVRGFKHKGVKEIGI